MILKKKPLTPSQRHTISLKKNHLDSFFLKRKKKGFDQSHGKNQEGKITVLGKSGGHKRLYRNLLLNREKTQIQGKVYSINYDPNRSAHLMGVLVQYNNFLSEIEYLLAPEGIKKGMIIESSPQASIQIGNALPLKNIPIGSLIHNISLKQNQEGKLIRSAGTSAQLIQKVGQKYAKVRLKSGELRLIPSYCYATLGVLSNIDQKNQNYGKAGRSRWLNKRPSVRGVAKNPVDHPHGGGEGKTSGGRPSVTPRGIITKGKPTRKKKKKNALILSRRKK